MATQNNLNRRTLLKGLGLGAIGSAVGMPSLCRAAMQSAVLGQATAVPFRQKGKGLLWTPLTETSHVAMVKGNDRRDITGAALKKIEDEVVTSLQGKKRVLIKPNFVTTNRPLCATHVDAIRAILDFLKPHFKGQIIIGESTASRAGTFDGYKNYGYLSLQKEYGVKLIDLNAQSYHWGYVFGSGNRPLKLRLIDTFFDPDTYLISAAKLKTHDRVVTTLSLKNVLLAAPLNDYKKNDKGITHTQNKFKKDSVLHYNLFHLAQQIWPDLSVIDGFEGMQGEGPVGGDPYDSRLTIASTDALAADKVATRVMGFNPEDIMYLQAMTQAGMGQGDLNKITVLGNTMQECQCQFRMSKLLAEVYG
jgi:uncharacterized protein (DUF362 family)